MSQNPDGKTLLIRARLLLEEGQSDRALAELEAFMNNGGAQQLNEKQRAELDYLLGWCYTERRRWEDALRVLTPLPGNVEDEGDKENRINREKLAYCLMRLGYIAVNTARYEDASRHYTRCLKVLQDKRINLPLAKVTARYGLATTHVMRGLYAAAIQHYQEAINLCLYVDDDNEIGNIYYGLCDAYRRSGNLTNAQLAGQKALELYERCGNRHMEGVTHNILGRISYSLGDYRQSSDHYTEAITLATNYSGSRMFMVNCAALADLRLAENRLEEAKRYCQYALDTIGRLQARDEQLCGLTYLICGKVAHAEGRRSDLDEERRKSLQEAIKWFEMAKDNLSPTQAYPDVAELYEVWGQVLEDLGQFEDALLCWKSGYEALSSATGPSWY
jgi:tetratricopeptide (TPR) repeat protein